MWRIVMFLTVYTAYCDALENAEYRFLALANKIF